MQWKGFLPEPLVRDATELKCVLAKPACPVKGPLYYMYRDAALSAADRWWLKHSRLRYDITVIPPGDLCGEFVKTKGHYHPNNPSGTGYPEIYEVLGGKAHYLLQSRDLSDAVVVNACEGDVVVVPPGYGHVTINPAKGTALTMANIVSSAFESSYHDYENLRGAAYYEMNGGEFLKNPAYPKIPQLRVANAKNLPATELFPSPLYRLIERRDTILGFLNHPEQYGSVMGRFRFSLPEK
jgi:glucose-6-phosphate isomerase